MSEEDLIRACAESNDSASWEEFVARFHRPISLSIIRAAHRWGGFSSQVVDDLIQETYLKLCADGCRLLRDFSMQHPDAVVGYIKTIAVNVAHDHFKALKSQKRGEGHTDHPLDEIDVEGKRDSFGGQSAMEREILLREIDRCLQTCSESSDQERDRLIFWLYYQQGMTAKAISELPTVGLTVKGVESAILRLTRSVRERIAGLQSEVSKPSDEGGKGLRPAESF